MTDHVQCLLMRWLGEHHDKHSTENHLMCLAADANPDDVRRFWQLALRCYQDAPDRFQLQSVSNSLRDWLIQAQSQSAHAVWADDVVTNIVDLYHAWYDSPLPAHRLLALLIWYGGAQGWTQFAQLISNMPPRDATGIVEAMTPLWRVQAGDFTALYPALLDAVAHVEVAAIVLDFTNYLVRTQRITEHPASARVPALIGLLGTIVERLERFEEQSRTVGVDDLSQARQVSESIALAISLADCFALMKQHDAAGKLYRMMELGHRRLRVEAAAALARLGEQAGQEALVAMASEPGVRLRVHAYAAELGLLDQVAAAYRSPASLAEATLAARLAEPDYLGVAPRELELVDARRLYWPGFDEPQDCFLFRFHATLPQQDLVNLGIAGPITHAVIADISAWEPEDAYALFAGLQVEHVDIRQWQIDPSLPEHQRMLPPQIARLQQHGLQEIRPEFWAQFFEKRLLVASALRNGVHGTAITGPADFAWLPRGNPLRPVQPETAFQWYAGREMLRHFNPDGDW